MSAPESANKKLDKMIDKLLKEAETDISAEKADGFKMRLEAAKVAIAWEKVKGALADQNEGDQFGLPTE